MCQVFNMCYLIWSLEQTYETATISLYFISEKTEQATCSELSIRPVSNQRLHSLTATEDGWAERKIRFHVLSISHGL